MLTPKIPNDIIANLTQDKSETLYEYNTGDKVYHILNDRFGKVLDKYVYNEIWYVVKWDDGLGSWSVPGFLLLPERLVNSVLYELINNKG